MATTAKAITVKEEFSNEQQIRFNSAYKKIDSQNTFFCNCPYSELRDQATFYTPFLAVCEYHPRKDKVLASTIDWDYVVPLESIALSLPCGAPIKKRFKKPDYSGAIQKCESDLRYQAAKKDLINIVPAIGEVKKDRSAFIFSELDFEPRKYGLCDFEVRPLLKRAEPKKDIRGDIARIYFYMMKEYGLTINKDHITLLQSWNRNDPPSPLECKTLEWKSIKQGFPAPFEDCKQP